MSAIGKQVNLALRLLDDQLFDAEDHRCGRVDDVQLRGSPGSRSDVSELLVGPGAWADRLRDPFRTMVAGASPDHMHVVPWDDVNEVSTAVHLSKTAKDLGLETRDGRNVQWLDAPPRGTFRLSQLLSAHLVTSGGAELGRVRDIRVERQTDVPDEHVNEDWRVVGLLTGRAGLWERIGWRAEGDPVPSRSFIPWTAVQEFTPGVVVISETGG